jgi:hypothetical protein
MIKIILSLILHKTSNNTNYDYSSSGEISLQKFDSNDGKDMVNMADSFRMDDRYLVHFPTENKNRDSDLTKLTVKNIETFIIEKIFTILFLKGTNR